MSETPTPEARIAENLREFQRVLLSAYGCGGREFQTIEECVECHESEILERFETTGDAPSRSPSDPED